MDPNTAESRQLLSLIERIERLSEDLAQVREDVKEVYQEAKGHGYDVAVMRKIVAYRKQDRDKRAEQDEIFALYLNAIGMGDLPLARAAAEREFRAHA